MTDLEMTKLCAEAMGYIPWKENEHATGILVAGIVDDISRYDPLHDDSQVMALVKRFHLECYWNGSVWGVLDGPSGCAHELRGDLNRAIVECCSRMQLERTPDTTA